MEIPTLVYLFFLGAAAVGGGWVALTIAEAAAKKIADRWQEVAQTMRSETKFAMDKEMDSRRELWAKMYELSTLKAAYAATAGELADLKEAAAKRHGTKRA